MKVEMNIAEKDLENLINLCGKHSITVAQLFENVVFDLVGSGNGSYERDLIDSWFNRCWFGSFPEETLLKDILDRGYDPDDFLTAWNEQQYAISYPEEYSPEELENNWWDREIENMSEEWLKANPTTDIREQVEIIQKWIDERERYRNDRL